MNRVKFLIERDEKHNPINVQDINGNTLLHLVVNSENVEMVKYLLEQGETLIKKEKKEIRHFIFL